jgi:hypothetical protein
MTLFGKAENSLFCEMCLLEFRNDTFLDERILRLRSVTFKSIRDMEKMLLKCQNRLKEAQTPQDIVHIAKVAKEVKKVNKITPNGHKISKLKRQKYKTYEVK